MLLSLGRCSLDHISLLLDKNTIQQNEIFILSAPALKGGVDVLAYYFIKFSQIQHVIEKQNVTGEMDVPGCLKFCP